MLTFHLPLLHRDPLRRGDAAARSFRSRRAALVAGGVAGGVLALSLFVLLRALGPAALWSAPAHESEPRSLLATLWFPGHALRELPHLVALGAIWSLGWAPPSDGRSVGRRIVMLLGFATLVALPLFGAAAFEEGIGSALEDLAQARAAPDLVAPGAHFRFHVWSDIAAGGLIFATARWTSPLPRPAGARGWLAPGAAVLALAGAVALWGLAGATTPRTLGHNAREIETTALVVVPLLAAWALARANALPHAERLAEAPVRFGLAVSGIVLVWLAIGSTRLDLRRDSSNPQRPLTLNLAVHHFEHVFDAAYLLLVAALTRRATARDRGTR